MSNTSNVINDSAERNAANVPEWLAYAFVKAGDAIQYNCSWGFITAKDTESPEFKNVEADLKKHNGKDVRITRVMNGYISEIPFDYMPKVFKTVMPETPDKVISEYLKKNQEVYNRSKEDFNKWIDKLIAGKVETKKVNGFSVVDFGLYCVNQTYTIKDGDTLYKAYKMSIPTFVKLLQQKGVVNKFYVSDGKNGPIPVNNAAIAKMIKIAESKNGVVFKLCYKA